MIKNYFKLAWRNLMKNKVFSFINIFGLAIGLSCCLLIAKYIVNELSYDTHHVNKERVFQLGTNFMDDDNMKAANTSAPLGSLMKQEFAEIEQTTRLMNLWRDDKTLFQYTDEEGVIQSFYENRGYLADSTLLQVLTYDFIEGNKTAALNEPNSVILSEEIAKKIFGSQPAIGKIIRISSSTNGDHDYQVTGVYKIPSNSISY
jgi:putative ABC transport system permease protein